MIKRSRKTTFKIINQQLSKSEKRKWPQDVVSTQSKKITKIKFVTKIKTNISTLEAQNSQDSQREISGDQTQMMILATKQNKTKTFHKKREFETRNLLQNQRLTTKIDCSGNPQTNKKIFRNRKSLQNLGKLGYT